MAEPFGSSPIDRKKALLGDRNRRPPQSPLNLCWIPAEMASADRWVVWRWEWREGKGASAGKWDKVPYRASRPGVKASSTDPATWGPMRRATEAYCAGKADGVGFVLGDPFAGVDLDGCRDPETGALADWAEGILATLGTYAEVSPSETGVKAFVRARHRHEKHKLPYRGGEVEVYDSARYFTVTGERLRAYPMGVGGSDAALAAAWQVVLDAQPKPKPQLPMRLVMGAAVDLADDEVLRRAAAAKNGDRFARLWAGITADYDNDHSRADAALCAMLWFWTGDRNRVDALFRQSGLMRHKWDQMRGEKTYGERTLDKACKGPTYSADFSGALTPGCPQESHIPHGIHEILGDILSLTDLPNPPPGQACPSARKAQKPVLRHKLERGLTRAICAPCRRWTCCVCLRRLAYERGVHHAGVILSAGGPVEVASVPPDDWAVVRKQLARAGASFLRVDVGGAYTVFATAPFPGSVTLSAEDAVRRLGQLLRGLEPRLERGWKGKPVLTSSKDWKPPARAKKPEAERLWKRVSTVRVRDPEPIRAYLATKKIDACVREGVEGLEWSVTWVFPAWWSEDAVAEVLSALRLMVSPEDEVEWP